MKLGKYYQVIGEVIYSETLKKLIIYKALYNSKKFGKNFIWARSKSMFLENVNINSKKVPRFKLINN